MKQSLFIILLFVASKNAFSQSASKLFYFDEVSMFITVPSTFENVGYQESDKLKEKGIKTIESANDVEVDMSGLKDLLSIRKGQFNYMNITITSGEFIDSTEWLFQQKLVKDMVYKSFVEMATEEKLDSSSRMDIVGEKEFDHFTVAIEIMPGKKMHFVLLSRFMKGYDLGICYVYLDEAIGVEFKEMVKGVRFKE